MSEQNGLSLHIHTGFTAPPLAQPPSTAPLHLDRGTAPPKAMKSFKGRPRAKSRRGGKEREGKEREGQEDEEREGQGKWGRGDRDRGEEKEVRAMQE